MPHIPNKVVTKEVYLLAVLIGYQLSPNKPSISINNDNLQLNY